MVSCKIKTKKAVDDLHSLSGAIYASTASRRKGFTLREMQLLNEEINKIVKILSEHFKEDENIEYQELKTFRTILPKYVTVGGGPLRLRRVPWNYDKLEYYRDGGNWSVAFKRKKGKLFSIIPYHKHLHNLELIPCSKKEYDDSNGQYAKETNW